MTTLFKEDLILSDERIAEFAKGSSLDSLKSALKGQASGRFGKKEDYDADIINFMCAIMYKEAG
jgi:hypothetical protein